MNLINNYKIKQKENMSFNIDNQCVKYTLVHS